MKKFICYVGIAAVLASAAVASAGVVDTALPTLPGDTKASKIIYTVTGVIDNNSSIATCVTCANVDKSNLTIGMEVFNWDGVQLNDASAGNGSRTLHVGTTRTICTNLTDPYNEDEVIVLSGAADQGTARIVSTSKKILCSAAVLARTGFSMSSLSVFRQTKQGGN